MTERQTDLAIIGGGITGLAAAYSLKKTMQRENRTNSFLLLEQSSRLGGKIFTETIDGFVIEGGPDCFISEKPAALRICAELNLQEELLKTNDRYHRTYILWKGKLHPLPEGFMLLAPTNFTSFAVDSLISPLGKLRVALDLVLPAKRSDDEETLAQFVRRRMGEEVLEKIAEPLVAGVHASNPETMSLKNTFPRFIELENQHRSIILGMVKKRKQLDHMRKQGGPQSNYSMFMTLKKGLAQIPGALQAQLDPTSILLEKSVVSINANTGTKGRYRITFSDDTVLYAQGVIVTIPAHAATNMLQDLDSDLSSELASIPYISTATVSLGYRAEEVTHPLDGFGFVVPRLEKRKIMACTWTSRKFSHRAPDNTVLIRCFVGGAQNESLAFLEKPELVRTVREELRTILGIQADPLISRAYRWKNSMPQYVVGHGEKIERIEKVLARHPGLFLAGSAYQGIGISDCIVGGEKAASKSFDCLSELPRPQGGAS